MKAEIVIDNLEHVYLRIVNPISENNKVNTIHKLWQLIEVIKKEGIQNTPKILKRQIRISSQRGVLLDFMQRNPEKKIMDVHFQIKLNKLPFIGAKPGARLSELKSMGLIDVVGKQQAVMTFEKKCRQSNIYKINQEGLNYILKS